VAWWGERRTLGGVRPDRVFTNAATNASVAVPNLSPNQGVAAATFFWGVVRLDFSTTGVAGVPLAAE